MTVSTDFANFSRVIERHRTRARPWGDNPLTLLRLALGFFLIVLGLAYLFQPKTIIRFNAFMRQTLFNDTQVLLNSRRVGFSLFAFGALLWILNFIKLK